MRNKHAPLASGLTHFICISSFPATLSLQVGTQIEAGQEVRVVISQSAGLRLPKAAEVPPEVATLVPGATSIAGAYVLVCQTSPSVRAHVCVLCVDGRLNMQCRRRFGIPLQRTMCPCRYV